MGQMLPIAAFATTALPRHARYDAWRNLVSSVFEPSPPADGGIHDWQAEAQSVHLGQVLIIRATAESQHFTRSRRLIAIEGLDHYLIQVYRQGVCRGTYGQVQNTVHPADIKIIDLARPFHTLNTAFDNITLTIPPHHAGTPAAEPGWHAWTRAAAPGPDGTGDRQPHLVVVRLGR